MRQRATLNRVLIACRGPIITAGGYKARKKSEKAPIPVVISKPLGQNERTTSGLTALQITNFRTYCDQCTGTRDALVPQPPSRSALLQYQDHLDTVDETLNGANPVKHALPGAVCAALQSCQEGNHSQPGPDQSEDGAYLAGPAPKRRVDGLRRRQPVLMVAGAKVNANSQEDFRTYRRRLNTVSSSQ